MQCSMQAPGGACAGMAWWMAKHLGGDSWHLNHSSNRNTLPLSSLLTSSYVSGTRCKRLASSSASTCSMSKSSFNRDSPRRHLPPLLLLSFPTSHLAVPSLTCKLRAHRAATNQRRTECADLATCAIATWVRVVSTSGRMMAMGWVLVAAKSSWVRPARVTSW